VRARFFDPAGPPKRWRWRAWTRCLPLHRQRRRPKSVSFAAQWLACTFLCRRFADILTNACARLGADVGRYSFIAVDLRHLLLAGLPAHLCENAALFCDWSSRAKFFAIFLLLNALGARKSEQIGPCEHAREFSHVWTAPRVKGSLEALRSFRVRTCLRPVGAEKIAPLALMRIRLVPRPISLTRSYRRCAKSGLRNLSVRSHHPLVTLDAFSPCGETSFCRALLAQATIGRSS
jgi:hypothetical protein